MKTLVKQLGEGLITLDEFIHKWQDLGPQKEWRVVGTQANGFPIDKIVSAPSAGIAALWSEIEGSHIVSVRLQ